MFSDRDISIWPNAASHIRKVPSSLAVAISSPFVSRYAEELSTGPHLLAEASTAMLEAHDWRGNVRELENAIKRALVLASGEVLLPEDFSFIDSEAPRRATGVDLPGLVLREVETALEAGSDNIYRRILERVERPLIEAALTRTDGNQIRAAALLGINRNTLRKKIVDLDIQLPGRD